MRVFIALTLCTIIQSPNVSARGQEPNDSAQFKPIQIDPKDGELEKLLKLRYIAAKGEFEGYVKQRAAKEFSPLIVDAAERLVRAGLELKKTPEERVKFISEVVEKVKAAEAEWQKFYDMKLVDSVQLNRLRYFRYDMEITLFRETQKSKQPKAEP